MNHILGASVDVSTAPSLVDTSEQILHFLSRATTELGSSLDFQDTIEQICKLMTPDLAQACSIWWGGNDTPYTLLTQKQNSYPLAFNEFDISPVIKTGTLMTQELPSQAGHVMAVPMRLRNQIVGVLILFSAKVPFSKTDCVVSEEIAFRAAMALDNSRLFQELKLTEDYLQKSRQIADVENQAKSIFLANMSHEIRTPLTAILGYLDLILIESEMGLAANRSPKRSADLSERIRANGSHLMKLIDQVLDISKIESGKIEICNEAVNLSQFLTEIYDTLSLQAKRKKNNLEFHLDSTIPAWVQTDPTRLKQIITNIVGNALKFTENGLVAVRLNYDTETSQLAFLVTDSGIGLTAEQKLKIFNPYAQADASTTKNFGGTGLGLSLSKQFAQHMNGDIILVSSKPNCGTTFKISIQAKDVSNQKLDANTWQPAVRPPIIGSDEASGLALNDVSILLAEDSPDNQLIIKMILEKEGARVEVAPDGVLALQMASERQYDIILMDIELPKMNGHIVCQKLRLKNYRKPILALTAHALKKEREQSIQFGCDAHLTKPIDRYLLISTIQSYLNRKMDLP